MGEARAGPTEVGQAVKYVTLPDVSQGVQTNAVAMHIFSIATGLRAIGRDG